MSNIPTPYGGPSYAEHRRPAQVVGADADRCDLVSSSAFGGRIAQWQSPSGRDRPLPEWPTFRLAHLSECSRPTRSSGCLWSTAFTWRQSITKAIGRMIERHEGGPIRLASRGRKGLLFLRRRHRDAGDFHVDGAQV